MQLPSCRIVEDRSGRLWLPIAELKLKGVNIPKDLEVVAIDDTYYDVVGYSLKRQAFWIKPIAIEGAAANIEDELDELQ